MVSSAFHRVFHRLAYAVLVCLSAGVWYWVATPLLELYPSIPTLPALLEQLDGATIALIAAGFVSLVILTELCSISWCMYNAWKLPRIKLLEREKLEEIVGKGALRGPRDGHRYLTRNGQFYYCRVTGRKERPRSVTPASGLESCALDNMEIIKERFKKRLKKIPGQSEIDLAIEDADHRNAYTLGMDTQAGGKHLICLSSKLVEGLPAAITAAVVGHEMGHVMNQDAAMKLFMGCFRSIVSMILFAPIYIICFVAAILRWVFSGIAFLGIFANFFLLFLSILIRLLRFLEQVVMYPAHLYERYVSRRGEYLADAASALTMGPNAIGRALYLIEKDTQIGQPRVLHLVNEKLWVISSTHPSFKDRIKAIRSRTYDRALRARPDDTGRHALVDK